MKISAKLALVLSAAVAVSVGASGLAFVQLQRGALRRAESEKERLLLDGVQKVAGESLLAKDPLMLVSYLTYLRRDRPEVSRCRFLLDGQWQDIAGAQSSSDASQTHLVKASLPDGRESQVEVAISSDLLVASERRQFEAMLRDVAKAGGAAALLGLLLSIPLSRTLTRRIVRIETALEEIGKGGFTKVEEDPGSDEISRLSRGVNEMSSQLGELDEMKKLLVASVSHELRSPLSAIEANVRELLGQMSAGPAASRLESIRRHAARLEHFVSSMLEMARIERGKLDYSPRLGELGPVVEDAAAFFAPRARDAGLEITAKVAPGLPAFSFDADLIGQVLANLLSNAIKFTEKGGKLSIDVRQGAAQIVVCSVTDTGVGIPAEALNRIFTPFERVPNMLRATGTGLGLAISKAIVERHGGRMGAESAPGTGSRFYFELPLAPSPKQ